MTRAFPARTRSHGEHLSRCRNLMIITQILCRLGNRSCINRYWTEPSRNRFLVVSIFLTWWWWWWWWKGSAISKSWLWKEKHHQNHHESYREATHCWCWWDVSAWLQLLLTTLEIFFCSKKNGGVFFSYFSFFFLLASAKNGAERIDMESPIHKAPAFMQGDIIVLNGKERRRAFGKWDLSEGTFD